MTVEAAARQEIPLATGKARRTFPLVREPRDERRRLWRDRRALPRVLRDSMWRNEREVLCRRESEAERLPRAKRERRRQFVQKSARRHFSLMPRRQAKPVRARTK